MVNVFVEVTHTEESELNTGIQRVVRNILRNLLQLEEPQKLMIRPVVLVDGRLVITSPREVLRDKSASAAPPVVPADCRISLSRSALPRQFFGKGWSHPENWGTWTIGDEAQLRLEIDATDMLPSHVQFNIGALVAAQQPLQRIELLANGVAIGAIQCTASTHGTLRRVTFALPNDVWNAGDRRLTLTIRTPDAISPAQLGLSEDPRVLGAQVSDIELLGPNVDAGTDETRSDAAERQQIDLEDYLLSCRHDTNVLLLLDSSWPYDIWPAVAKVKRAGSLLVVSVIYDLIPLTHPHTCVRDLTVAFEAWLRGQMEHADTFVCISDSVARTLRDYLDDHGEMVSRATQIPVRYFYLGADLDFSASGSALTERVAAIIHRDEPFFLMVGSLEPRKNHRQVFEAFKRLWASGVNASLVIVGSHGWKVEDLLAEIHEHPAFGDRLQLIRGASDTEVAHLYENAAALIIASEVEGFGLPVVEARKYGIPVICSDIPVFREIASGTGVTFFKLHDVQHLEEVIRAELSAGRLARTAPGTWITWNESAKQLLAELQRAVRTRRIAVPTRTHRLKLPVTLRDVLLRRRVLRVLPELIPSDPYSAEYLILALQARRVSLSANLAALRGTPWRRRIWGLYLVAKDYLELKLAVLLTESLLLEKDLAAIETTRQTQLEN